MSARNLVYSPVVQAYFDNPARSGTLQAPLDEQIVGRAGSVSLGGTIEFQLHIVDQQIHDAKFRVYGCPHTVATAAWVTDQVIGLTRSDLGKIVPKAIAQALDLPVEKMRCALLAEDALAACMAQWWDR